MSERVIFVPPDGITFRHGPSPDGPVVYLVIEGLSGQLGLGPEFSVVLSLSPDEADQTALALVRTAASARAQPAPKT